MTHVVVEIGPGTVRGLNEVPPELISVALESIDDDLALLDDRPVPVADVWRDVLCAAAGSDADTVVLVCPTWWPGYRIERIRMAALAVAPEVVVMRRASALRDGLTGPPTTILEIDADFVVVSHAVAKAVVIQRRGADVDAVVSAVGESAAVLVDAPEGVEGAQLLGAVIAHRWRAKGIAVRFAGEDAVRRAVLETRRAEPAEDVDVPLRVGRRHQWGAVLAGITSAVVLCAGLALRGSATDAPAGEVPMTLLVEGRVGVMVPAAWRVQRITAGPGSARVQIVSLTDDDVAINLTQSPRTPGVSLAMAAESLRTALSEEPGGVFVDFNPSDHRADRPAVTYREIRQDRRVEWVVFVEDGVRIAIGCQSAVGREEVVRDVCDRVIRTAHPVF